MYLQIVWRGLPLSEREYRVAAVHFTGTRGDLRIEKYIKFMWFNFMQVATKLLASARTSGMPTKPVLVLAHHKNASFDALGATLVHVDLLLSFLSASGIPYRLCRGRC